VTLFAFAKGMIVFGGALLLAWATGAAMRFIPFGPQLIGEGKRLRVHPRSSSDDLALDRHGHRRLPAPSLARQ
jgi:hypothetical protein